MLPPGCVFFGLRGWLTFNRSSWTQGRLGCIALISPRPQSSRSSASNVTGGLGVCWIAMALETVRSKNLQQVIIHPNSSTFVDEIGGMIYQEWLDLDRTLAQLCTSLSIRLQVMCEWVREGDDYYISYLSLRSLPEVTRRGLIDLIPTGA